MEILEKFLLQYGPQILVSSQANASRLQSWYWGVYWWISRGDDGDDDDDCSSGGDMSAARKKMQKRR